MLKKICVLLIIFLKVFLSMGYSQVGSDGSYLWNSTSLTYSINETNDLVLGNRDNYNFQINHLDYYHIDLIFYHKLSKDFSLGLGFRQTESFKIDHWNPGQAYLFYGVYVLSPSNFRIRLSSRIAVKTYKNLETFYGFDNFATVDFFTKSVNKIPKPYITGELFNNIEVQKVQAFRLFGGLHVLKLQHFGIDVFYAYWKTRPAWVWKDYNIFGLSTKVRI